MEYYKIMLRSHRSMWLPPFGLACLLLAGCENNEARVDGGGVTPSGASADSNDGLKVKVQNKSNPYGMGPKSAPSSSSKPAPAAPAPGGP